MSTLPPLPKPTELLAVHGIAIELFTTMKRWFIVPDRITLDLSSIDAATREMGNPTMIAAMALRKLQAIADDPAALRAHLLRTSMIEGLRQAEGVI